MSLLRTVARLWLAGVLLAAAGCSDSTGPVGPGQRTDDAALRPGSLQQPADDPVSLARGVRGFGGFFLDPQGAPTIYLTDPAEADAAAHALMPFLAARGMDRSRLQVRRGDFEYARLESWFEALSPEALAIPGAVYADLDEASNRLRVGMVRGAGAAGLHRALAALHVPVEAVIVQETAPIRQLATLQERVRPVQGGLMIDFILGLCSLGFNALRSGQLSFVIASHCTWAQGGIEGTIWYQHTWLDFSGNDNTIGSEVDDPVYITGRRGKGGNGCPRNRVCRRSDSARGAYSIAAANVALGQIARTSGENNGLIDLMGSFQITAEHPSELFAIGSTVHKVGMTTGWTSAAVSATCANVNIDGTSITQLCQTLAGFEGSGHPVIVGPGDSGSPIFIKTGDATVTLAGILWGGTPEGGLLAFSPLKNVQQELGDLVVVAP